MKTITTQELETILANTTTIKGMANFVSITQFTTPKTTKKDRDTKEPFNGNINKLTTLSVLLNTEYEKVVTNQLTKENKDKEDYKKGNNTMPLVKGTNNNFYGTFYGKGVIEYKPNTNTTPRTKFLLNGKVTNKSKLPNVLPTVNKATNQGTDKEILWRKLYIKNIRRININGQKYKVVN